MSEQFFGHIPPQENSQEESPLVDVNKPIDVIRFLKTSKSIEEFKENLAKVNELSGGEPYFYKDHAVIRAIQKIEKDLL